MLGTWHATVQIVKRAQTGATTTAQQQRPPVLPLESPAVSATQSTENTSPSCKNCPEEALVPALKLASMPDLEAVVKTIPAFHHGNVEPLAPRHLGRVRVRIEMIRMLALLDRGLQVVHNTMLSKATDTETKPLMALKLPKEVLLHGPSNSNNRQPQLQLVKTTIMLLITPPLMLLHQVCNSIMVPLGPLLLRHLLVKLLRLQ